MIPRRTRDTHTARRAAKPHRSPRRWFIWSVGQKRIIRSPVVPTQRLINIPACISKEEAERSRTSQPSGASAIKDSLSLAFLPARLLSSASCNEFYLRAPDPPLSVSRCYLPQPTRVRSARADFRISANTFHRVSFDSAIAAPREVSRPEGRGRREGLGDWSTSV